MPSKTKRRLAPIWIACLQGTILSMLTTFSYYYMVALEVVAAQFNYDMALLLFAVHTQGIGFSIMLV